MGGDPDDPFWSEEDQRAMPGLQETADSWWGIKRNQFADNPRAAANPEPVLIETWLDGPPKQRPEDPGIAADRDNPPNDADLYADSDWDDDKW